MPGVPGGLYSNTVSPTSTPNVTDDTGPKDSSGDYLLFSLEAIASLCLYISAIL